MIWKYYRCHAGHIILFGCVYPAKKGWGPLPYRDEFTFVVLIRSKSPIQAAGWRRIINNTAYERRTEIFKRWRRAFSKSSFGCGGSTCRKVVIQQTSGKIHSSINVSTLPHFKTLSRREASRWTCRCAQVQHSKQFVDERIWNECTRKSRERRHDAETFHHCLTVRKYVKLFASKFMECFHFYFVVNKRKNAFEMIHVPYFSFTFVLKSWRKKKKEAEWMWMCVYELEKTRPQMNFVLSYCLYLFD